MLPSLLLLLHTAMPAELGAYVRRPEPATAWTKASESGRRTELKLTSQTWQGSPWKHDLLVVAPRSGRRGKEAILLITGGKGSRDMPIAQALADASDMEVAVLFQVPNQPLYDRTEDALIAYTFGKWLETGDSSWPLLMPMTKSGIKAMDALQGWSQGRLKSFIVTGASKRGWTTWLVGATGDKRVKALAPMVIDILNMPAQLEKQRKMFGGKLSEQIADYSETGLTELLSSPQGQALTRMVDPYNYLPGIKVPVLVIVGGNDRYWTVDAHTLYWEKIRGPKLLRIVPNAGHSLGDGRDALASLAFFSRAVTGAIPGGIPRVEWKPGSLDLRQPAGDKRFAGYETWVATSESQDFRDSKWMDASVVRLDGTRYTAQFLEYKFEAGGLSASFTSGAVVRPPQAR